MHIRHVALLSLMLSITSCTSTAVESHLRVRRLVSEDGSVTQPLLDLLEVTAQRTDTGEIPTILEEAKQTTQRFVTEGGWRRPAGKERFELDEVEREYVAHLESDGTDVSTLRALFQEAGLVDAVLPQMDHYHAVVIHGARLSAVRSRLNHVQELWDDGIRFDHLVLIGGERTLTDMERGDTLLAPSSEGFETNTEWSEDEWVKEHGTPETESDMIEIVYAQAALSNEVRSLPVQLVRAKRKPDGSRPTTIDTLRTWFSESSDEILQAASDGKSILFISSQPHVTYQDTVTHLAFPDEVSFETVGRAAEETTFVTVFLDALTRILYSESQRRAQLSSVASA